MQAREMSSIPLLIKKRKGDLVHFDGNKIEEAIFKAMRASGGGTRSDAKKIRESVIVELSQIKQRFQDFVPSVEGVQDLVEKTLIRESSHVVAKTFILYREKRNIARQGVSHVSEKVQQLNRESRRYFSNSLNEFVFLRTYARWIEEEGRRESWVETVDRYIKFMRDHLGDRLQSQEYEILQQAILTQAVMPSMRLMQFAGKAANSTHVSAYNCSFIAPRELTDFAEVMYVLMCGTGVGFSVEDQNVQNLPQIKVQSGHRLPPFIVPDSREGWSDAIKIGLQAWYEGTDLDFDFSLCRPAGSRLKTFGGKSSGPEPLANLLNFIRNKVLRKQRSRLSSIDVHDILCKMGEAVVAGGVRRSAMISLSDLSDTFMRDAKSGHFYNREPQRVLANNSAVYSSKPSNLEFFDEWLSLMKSGSGERGIFNRQSLLHTLPHRRLEYLASRGQFFDSPDLSLIGTNPCGEIILRSKQFCNLTEVIARPHDNIDSLMSKIKLATILGTYQSTLTKFPYLSKEWKENCEAERLLGVSITGQWDCEAVRNASVLSALREESIKVNLEYSQRFGINPSTAITCVKPSGSVSQVVDCASGMHPRFASYYIRRIRISANDALFKLCRDQGVPFHPEVGQSFENATTFVLEFPVKSPDGCTLQSEVSATEQLDYWKIVKQNYTEHNPSVTIYVGEDEWVDVAHWVYKNWDIVGGLTFLPRTNHIYQLAPYEEITKEQYETLKMQFENVDFSKLITYESYDETEMKRELACAGGGCEL